MITRSRDSRCEFSVEIEIGGRVRDEANKQTAVEIGFGVFEISYFNFGRGI